MSLAFFLTGLIVLPFIAVPILIWYTQKFSAEVNLRIIQETFLPMEVLEVFRKFGASLSKQGFEHLADAIAQDQLLGLRFYHRILLNHFEKTWGICVAICDEDGNFHKNYSEFRTQFANKSSYLTHNLNLFDAPIRANRKKTLALPSEVDTEMLFEFHQYHVKKETNEIMELPKNGDAVLAFKAFFTEENDELLNLGAIYFNEPEKIYRPTVAGAVLIGWYNMWPFTSLRRMWTTVKFKILLRQLASPNS